MRMIMINKLSIYTNTPNQLTDGEIIPCTHSILGGWPSQEEEENWRLVPSIHPVIAVTDPLKCIWEERASS